MSDAWSRELWWLAGLSGALLLFAASRTERGAVLAADAAGAVVTTFTPRGIRNHNPGNLRPGSRWLGLADPPSDGEYLRFVAPVYGLRAAALLLRNYQRRNGLRTPQQIVNRWAPPSGRMLDGRAYTQDSDGYAAFVARRLGVQPTDAVDLNDPQRLETFLRAVVAKENGARWESTYSATLYREAVAQALRA